MSDQQMTVSAIHMILQTPQSTTLMNYPQIKLSPYPKQKNNKYRVHSMLEKIEIWKKFRNINSNQLFIHSDSKIQNNINITQTNKLFIKISNPNK